MANEEKKFLDQEGVKYLWSKISMQDYPNNSTLAAVIEAIDETKADKDELVQADWNETDETSLAFIKNKPSIATDDDILLLLISYGFIIPVTDSTNYIYLDTDQKILLM